MPLIDVATTFYRNRTLSGWVCIYGSAADRETAGRRIIIDEGVYQGTGNATRALPETA